MRGENLNLNFGVEQIFEDTSFFINDNDKVGIVGVNGAGKTTLFKVILGYQELNSGKIVITNNKRIGYLPQEIILDNKDVTVFDYLMSARPIKELEDKLATLYEKVAIASDKEQNKIMKAIANTQAKLEYYDYYKAESILFELLDNMHIDGDLLDMKLVNLSGGQKSKIAFAHLLYSKPEILLLDEPTNHLDVDTRDYVINYLKRYKGMVLIISHDVDFLDKITDHTLHLNKLTKKITMFEGNYTTYLKKSKALAEAKEKLIQKQEKEEKKLRDIVLLYSNSSGKRKQEVTNYYVNIIAHLIISYKLTLNQAITLSGYNISSGKLSTHLSKDLDKNLYLQVKKVLDEFNGSKTTKEQREYFEQLLEKKKRDDEAFYELPHARDILNVADEILSGKNISKVAKNYNCTRNELIDHIMELLPIVDYNKYLQVLIKLRLFNLEKQYYNDEKTYTYEQEPITNFRR